MGTVMETEDQLVQTMQLAVTNEEKPDRLEAIIRDLMTELSLDLDDQHFKGTPARVARLCRELTCGYRTDPADILKTLIRGTAT